MHSPTSWKFQHTNADGQLIWASGLGELGLITPGSKEFHEALMDQPWTPNVLTDEGENAILGTYFRAATAPTNFYMGLANSTIGETSTLATITEASGGGYARLLVERSATGFPTFSGDTITSSTETFTASGGTIGPVTDAFLATVVSGTAGLLLVGDALSTTRTLADGESLNVTVALTLG